MKRGLLLCLIIGLGTFMFSGAVEFHDIRIAGTAGSFISVVIDTADTVADPQGTAPVYDTTFSDTLDISEFNYVTVYGKLSSIDTGSELTNDTLMDTLVLHLITTIDEGTANWTVVADTFTNVGDSFRHHYVVDTMLYEEIFWKSIYWDSVDPSVVDTNDYYIDLEVLCR